MLIQVRARVEKNLPDKLVNQFLREFSVPSKVKLLDVADNLCPVKILNRPQEGFQPNIAAQGQRLVDVAAVAQAADPVFSINAAFAESSLHGVFLIDLVVV